MMTVNTKIDLNSTNLELVGGQDMALKLKAFRAGQINVVLGSLPKDVYESLRTKLDISKIDDVMAGRLENFTLAHLEGLLVVINWEIEHMQ